MITSSSQPARQPLVGLTIIVLLATVLVSAPIAPAQARSTAAQPGAHAPIEQQTDIGAGAAAAAASAASGGRVLQVKRRAKGSGVVYRVKVLLPGGRMRTLTVDGQTGQVRG